MRLPTDPIPSVGPASRRPAAVSRELPPLAELLEFADPMLQLDAQWHIVRINEKLAVLCGRPAGALLDRVVWDVWPEWALPGTSAWRACQDCMHERTTATFDVFLSRAGVSYRATAHPLRAGGIAVFFREETALRSTEAALRDSEARFRSMFEQSAVGIARVRLADGRWNDVNETFCRMVGRTREELLALTWPDITHPEDIDVGLASFRRMAAGELDSCAVDKRYLQPDGTVVWAKLTLSLVRDAAGRPEYEVAIIEDVRERKAAEREAAQSKRQLEAERARLQTIIDTIPTGLLMVDEQGRSVLENDEWRRTWTGEAAAGAALAPARYKAFRPDTGEAVPDHELPHAVSLAQGVKTRDVVLDIERADGRRATVVVSSAPIIDQSGAVIGAVAANMDITELRRVQARLQEADARKDEFLVMLSHELRNPLAPIRTSLQILDRVEPSAPQALRAREIISRQVTHLTGLVDDLLDVSRIARGKVELRRTRVDLAQLARRTGDDYTAVMRERGLELCVLVDEEVLFVEGDETRLAQVLGNLLSNAAKFTPRGGKVEVQARRQDGHAVVAVRDSGIGMPADLLPTIFEAFIQAKQDVARRDGGLGLGLAIVKGLVELHGGKVAVSSTVGVGTEFTVAVPLSEGHVSDLPCSVPPPARQTRSRRVLVVDDNLDAAESLAELVRLLGHEVDVAHDGLKAVALGRAARPSVVLCDLGLPLMDGYGVARTLRSALGAGTRLIALSGYARPEDVRRSSEAGFDAHIAKPPDPAAIERLLGG